VTPVFFVARASRPCVSRASCPRFSRHVCSDLVKRGQNGLATQGQDALATCTPGIDAPRPVDYHPTRMGHMRFANTELDPVVNPAVLDTVTWDPQGAWRVLDSMETGHWLAVHRAAAESRPLPVHACCTLYLGSCACQGASVYSLACLSDGQHVFIRVGRASERDGLGTPIRTKPLGEGMLLSARAADAAALRRYLRVMRPDKAPQAMGAVPRLGIGTRMSTSVWPGVWPAMEKGGFAANAIQNSVRELNLLQDVLAGRPPRSNYLYGFGTLEEGHTGSTFEGLWVAGVIEALKTDTHPRYGADADHITVRRGPGGIDRAKLVIDAARDYTFFTLDVSDIVDYTADHPARKYETALEVVAELAAYIQHVKGDAPFDLELSIDECPPRMEAGACLTTDGELTFLIEELRRRGIAMTHIAPNVGVVKGQDYDGPGGLEEFERRIRGLQRIARAQNVMLDFHSGDDLRPAVRRAIGRATEGWNHFKVSPSLQIIFAETLHDLYPERFRWWWEDTLAYARREADGGSDFAAQCLRQYEDYGDSVPAPRHAVFHHYCFGSVGRRDEKGRFLHRERFYDLPADFYEEYRDRIERFLCEVAADVFCRE